MSGLQKQLEVEKRKVASLAGNLSSSEAPSLTALAPPPDATSPQDDTSLLAHLNELQRLLENSEQQLAASWKTIEERDTELAEAKREAEEARVRMEEAERGMEEAIRKVQEAERGRGLSGRQADGWEMVGKGSGGARERSGELSGDEEGAEAERGSGEQKSGEQRSGEQREGFGKFLGSHFDMHFEADGRERKEVWAREGSERGVAEEGRGNGAVTEVAALVGELERERGRVKELQAALDEKERLLASSASAPGAGADGEARIGGDVAHTDAAEAAAGIGGASVHVADARGVEGEEAWRKGDEEVAVAEELRKRVGELEEEGRRREEEVRGLLREGEEELVKLKGELERERKRVVELEGWVKEKEEEVLFAARSGGAGVTSGERSGVGEGEGEVARLRAALEEERRRVKEQEEIVARWEESYTGVREDQDTDVLFLYLCHKCARCCVLLESLSASIGQFRGMDVIDIVAASCQCIHSVVTTVIFVLSCR